MRKMNAKYNLNVYLEQKCLRKSSFPQRRMRRGPGVWKFRRAEQTPGCPGPTRLRGRGCALRKSCAVCQDGSGIGRSEPVRRNIPAGPHATEGTSGPTPTLPPMEFEWLDSTCENSSIKPRSEYVIISDSEAFSGTFGLSYLSINMIIQLKKSLVQFWFHL